MSQSTNASMLLKAFSLFAILILAGCGSVEERAQGYYQRGMSLLEKGEDVRARLELRNAVQIKGDMVSAWRALAQIEERSRNWEALGTISRRIVELDPKDIDARLRLARFAFFSRAMDEALKLTNAAIEVDPRHTGALVLRAAILFRLNDNNGAIQETHKVLGIEPGNVDAIVLLAAERFARDDSKGALQILEDVPAARRDELSVLILKIRILDKLQDLVQLENHLRKVMELNPRESAFRRELIRFYISQKRHDDAEKELRASAAANPDDLNLVLELVRFLHSVRGPAAARAELVNRTKGGGRVFPYQIALAEFEFVQGNFAEGIQLLEGLISSANSTDDKVAAQTRLAEIQLSRKNLAAAESLVSNILRGDSRNINALRLRASIRLDQRQLDDAISDLRRALNDQPRAPELLSLLAIAYERNGSIELADKQLADATRASGFAPGVGLNYVTFLQRRGLNAHAENILIELASRNPGNIDVLSSLAQVKLARQDWIAAHEIATTIRRLGNQRNIADQIQAAALSGQKKFEESVGVLQNAYSANPDALQPMFALVRTYLQAQSVDKAEAFLHAVLRANPANAEANVLMGSIHLAKNATDDALKSFKTAIEQQPKKIIGYRALADFYVRQRSNEAAREVIQAGLREQPNNSTLRLVLAAILELDGNYDSAIEQYESLLKDEPGSMIVANNLASLIADHRTDKASLDRAYSIALSLTKSQVPHFKDTLGWIHYKRGEYKAAAPLLEEAAAQLPNFALIQYHLGMNYKALGDSEKASEQLRKAFELEPDNSGLKNKIRAEMEPSKLN